MPASSAPNFSASFEDCRGGLIPCRPKHERLGLWRYGQDIRVAYSTLPPLELRFYLSSQHSRFTVESIRPRIWARTLATAQRPCFGKSRLSDESSCTISCCSISPYLSSFQEFRRLETGVFKKLEPSSFFVTSTITGMQCTTPSLPCLFILTHSLSEIELNEHGPEPSLFSNILAHMPTVCS